MNLFPSHQLHIYISPFFPASPLHPIHANHIFRENDNRMRKSTGKALHCCSKIMSLMSKTLGAMVSVNQVLGS
ncbi:hypothetical protein Bca4012_088228 [Brassica carinata]